MRHYSRPSVRSFSVQHDWRAWLPESKGRVFSSLTEELETSYNMLSVSLNEAIALLLAGRREHCRQAATVLPDLSWRLSRPLAAMLRALGSHARHYGTVPNAAPLDPSNFRGPRCQRAARMSSLISHILLTQRSQFLHKVDELLGMVENLVNDFCETACEIWEDDAADPGKLWFVLELLHYDLNTCLRESAIVLKSFLRVLPDEELDSFEQATRILPAQPPAFRAVARALSHGRAASIGRE